MVNNQQGKYWCFTINNPEPEDCDKINALWNDKHAEFLVYQLEQGENGTKHLQGYICFKHNYRFNRIKKLTTNRIHLEKRRGTHSEARDYCTKDDTRVEGSNPTFLGKIKYFF